MVQFANVRDNFNHSIECVVKCQEKHQNIALNAGSSAKKLSGKISGMNDTTSPTVLHMHEHGQRRAPSWCNHDKNGQIRCQINTILCLHSVLHLLPIKHLRTRTSPTQTRIHQNLSLLALRTLAPRNGTYAWHACMQRTMRVEPSILQHQVVKQVCNRVLSFLRDTGRLHTPAERLNQKPMSAPQAILVTYTYMQVFVNGSAFVLMEEKVCSLVLHVHCYKVFSDIAMFFHNLAYAIVHSLMDFPWWRDIIMIQFWISMKCDSTWKLRVRVCSQGFTLTIPAEKYCQKIYDGPVFSKPHMHTRSIIFMI